MIANPFFVTGMLRSGTTLLQNILDSIPQLGCSNQQMTELFIQTKRDFLLQKNLQPYHILSNYFPPVSEPIDFTNYLNQQDFQHKYLQNLNQHKTGNKEVLAEEFISHLSKKTKIILIIRNPKDVLTSLRFGKYKEYTGKHRPLLFDIRNWRKSVAFAIKEETNPNFLLVKYENLVSNFEAEYNRILQFIFGQKVHNITPVEKSFPDNSSFGLSKQKIYTGSVNNFLHYLSPDIQNSIDFLCSPEMKYLGYSVKSELDIDLKKIEEFKNYNYSEREEFQDFDLVKELEREKIRLNYQNSATKISGNEIRENFIFEEVFLTLKHY